jgi:hypothetical protein
MEEMPTDYVRGTDFRITKTSKGGYADYSTSNWARRERALDEAEQAAIKQFGTFNLKDFLPKKPGEVELKIIKEMFEASVDGEAYDPDRWSQYFKPAGFNAPASSAPAQESAPKAVAPKAPVAEEAEDDAPFDTGSAKQEPVSAGGEASGRAADILAMIRNRNKQ